MKILMLGWELPPHNSGGLGVACYQLCKSLAQKGADIEFILPYDTPHDVDFMKILPAIPQSARHLHLSGGAYDSYSYINEEGVEEWHDIFTQQKVYEHSIDRIVQGREFDVIHAHDWLTFRAAVRAKARSNKPMVLHVHSIEHDRAGGKQGNPLVHEIEYTSMMLADKVIAVSNHTKNAIIRHYDIPADKIDVVHNSIELDPSEPRNEHNDFVYLEKMKEQGYGIVANVGRLTMQKGLPNFLRAAKEVVTKRPKTIFLIVGNGEQLYELMELAAELGISRNVIFTDFLRGKRWRDAFKIADLFVMPSVSEPFGLTPLEAAGYGTPSLISKQSGVAEVFYNCLKVDYWDTLRMADDIISVLNNDTLQEALSTAALDECRRMTWDTAAERFMQHYHHYATGVVAL